MRMREFLYIVKALADENRVRALCALKGGELCVCEIIELLGLAPSTVSKHMCILHQARLVDSRKSGRWLLYRLPGQEASAVVKQALAWVFSSLQDDATFRQDRKKLARIAREKRGGARTACPKQSEAKDAAAL